MTFVAGAFVTEMMPELEVFDDVDCAQRRLSSPYSSTSTSAPSLSSDEASDSEDVAEDTGLREIEEKLFRDDSEANQRRDSSTSSSSPSLVCDEVSESDDLAQHAGLPEIEEELCSGDAEAIQQHLEVMNSAADELNAAQKALGARVKEKRLVTQLWAVSSARWARTVGTDRLGRAKPYYASKRRCEAARSAVEAASAQYMAKMSSATDAGTSEAEVRRFASQHAQCLARYQNEQKAFAQALARSAMSSAALAAVLPYFDAEHAYLVQISEITADLEVLGQRVDTRKARYSNAMRALESFSEEVHRRRSSTI